MEMICKEKCPECGSLQDVRWEVNTEPGLATCSRQCTRRFHRLKWSSTLIRDAVQIARKRFPEASREERGGYKALKEGRHPHEYAEEYEFSLHAVTRGFENAVSALKYRLEAYNQLASPLVGMKVTVVREFDATNREEGTTLLNMYERAPRITIPVGIRAEVVDVTRLVTFVLDFDTLFPTSRKIHFKATAFAKHFIP